MKKIFTLLFILISGLSFSQNYKLFHIASRKLYTEFPVAKKAYSLAFDSVKAAGADSVYYNFFTLRDTAFPADTCFQEAFCIRQEIPVWTGGKIIDNNSGSYRFFNLSNDTLKFYFNISIGDTSFFYKDNAQKFSIIYEKKDTVSIFNNNDSAKFFKILHTDLIGNVINSVLNKKEIIFAKKFGLCQFFAIDSFPVVLKPLQLIGNNSPDGGLYRITDEVLYDYQPGDEIQYYDHYFSYYGPSPPYNHYIKYTFLNRTVTTDSLIYKVLKNFYNADSLTSYADTVILKYYRYNVLKQIPYELFDGTNHSLCLADYCGLKLWTYNYEDAGLFWNYCLEDNCWSPLNDDVPESITKTYVLGLGDYYYNDYLPPYAPPMGFYNTKSIVYFKKDSISCGSEVVVGVKKLQDMKHNVIIKPNPAGSLINITSKLPLHMITFYDIDGRLIMNKTVSGTDEYIDVSLMNEGIYFVKAMFADNKETFKKVIVIRN